MITIFQLKNLAEELNLVSRDQFFYKYLKETVLPFWEKKVAKKRHSKKAEKMYDAVTRAIARREFDGLTLFYPSCYGNFEHYFNYEITIAGEKYTKRLEQPLFWASEICVDIDGEKYIVIRASENVRTDDPKTHYGWGQDDNGKCIQTWKKFRCPINNRDYESVEDFKRDFQSIVDMVKADPESFHGVSPLPHNYDVNYFIATYGEDGKSYFC